MKLQSLSDRQLLQQTQQLVQKERELLSEILQHLKEVERRKLYSDLGYSSLFEYCLRELKYSEAQAGRRLQALKLIRELPQVEEKIASGALNLTHICQAQSFFKHVQKAASKGAGEESGKGASKNLDMSEGKGTSKGEIIGAGKNQSMNSSMDALNKEQKLQVLAEIANKSSRETQAILVAKTTQAGLAPQLPAERERMLSKEHSEVRLVLNQELRQRLEEVKSLLGPKALGMSLAELIGVMAELSLETLKDKKFGKRRGLSFNVKAASSKVTAVNCDRKASSGDTKSAAVDMVDQLGGVAKKLTNTNSLAEKPTAPIAAKNSTAPAKLCVKSLTKKPRSISKGEKWQIWQRDGGRCGQCGSQKNLQVDHCIPVGRGGTAELENLRLLCGNCNLRAGIKRFGTVKMRRPSPG